MLLTIGHTSSGTKFLLRRQHIFHQRRPCLHNYHSYVCCRRTTQESDGRNVQRRRNYRYYRYISYLDKRSKYNIEMQALPEFRAYERLQSFLDKQSEWE